MGDKIFIKYQKFFGKYQEDTENNKLFVLKIVGQKKGLFKYTITNIDLNNFINLGSDICPEWYKILFKAELSQRENFLIYIINSFLRLESQYDLFKPLGFLYGKVVYFLFKENNYTIFNIPKKSGGTRIINAPERGIKILQSRLSEILYFVHKSKSVSHGFELNKNIATNAKKHVNKKYVINLDLKDFFPTINFGRVRGLFKKEFGFNDNIVTILAQICCYEGKLPQGAPTSPIISNMICKKLDSRLHKISFDNKFNYSRYADDLTFSTNLYKIPTDFIDKIKKIIIEEGFELNNKKFRIQNRKIRQEVTGLSVNKRVNIKRSYIREVRAILHCWEIKGYEVAAAKYSEKYDKFRPVPNFSNSIRGKIEFIGMIRGKEDWIYKNYLDKFYNLCSIKTDIKIKKYLLHNPQETTDFLNQFSSDEFGLKALTHDCDDEYYFNINTVLKNAKKTLALYPALNKNLYKAVEEFLNFHTSEIMQEWYNNNPGKSPHKYCRNEAYKSIINTFKKQIRFKNGELEKFFIEIINNFKNETYLENLLLSDKFSFEFINLTAAKYYTDTKHFGSALRYLFVIISEYSSNGNLIKISYHFDNNSSKHVVQIIDVNSKIQNPSNKNVFIKGDLKKIKEHLFSLCDWYIEALFSDGYKRVHMLPYEKSTEILDKSRFEGIKHIFKFYN